MLVSLFVLPSGEAFLMLLRGGVGVVRQPMCMRMANALRMCCIRCACVPRVPLCRNGLKSTAKILFFCDTIKELLPKHQSQNIFLIILWPYVFF